MDNPQHYLPLSHALNPPHTAPPQNQYQTYDPTSASNGISVGPRPEEEEEEEDDDEGLVEDQLNENENEHEMDASSQVQPNKYVRDEKNKI